MKDRFIAKELALELARALKRPLAAIRTRDADLHRQMRRAAHSFVLNIAEGARRQGQDKRQLFRIAAGSTAEGLAALQLALAWDYLDPSTAKTALDLGDQLLAVLYVLTEKRPTR
jgi:four helix bundle protein